MNKGGWMKRVQISVIVPIYNVQEYLVECLDSLSKQTTPFDEVILVNDGSTDGSCKICEDYCEKYKNFILINQNNQGLSCARNKGMEVAQGDYILFVDSDDYVNYDMGTVLKNRLENEGLDVLYYCADVKHEVEKASRNNPYIREIQYCNNIMTGIEFFEKSFPQQYIVSACMAVYKKSFLSEKGVLFPAGLYYEDEVFCLEVLMHAKRVACILDQLYIRRYRSDSIMTSSINVKKCKDIIEVQLRNWALLHDQDRACLNTRTLRKFVSNGIYQVIDKIGDLNDRTAIEFDLKHLTVAFFKYWKELFVQGEMEWEDSGAFLFILKYARNKMSDLDQGNGLCYLTEEKYLKALRQRLSELPLNDSNKNIGIYGIGNHTAKMLDLYKKYVGNIEANIYFIVTEKNGTDEFLDCKVVACNEIPNNTDKIIISSKVYQNEMKNHLIGLRVRRDIIYLVYANEEICDLVLAWKVLKE